ncbi:MAG TPA: hypothetical protein VNX68_15495, partial [Nitrosopumilaceae archaeon]|nr:hypothetical protein [Nitrosopumilaceae archaeon]
MLEINNLTMKNLSLILNAILIVAVAVLFYLYLSLNNKLNPDSINTDPKDAKTETTKLITDPSKLKNSKIAYVNVDSINYKYNYITDYSK